MLNHYLKTTMRFLVKNRKYTIINIAGLASGFFCFLLLGFYVSGEKNYDNNLGGVYRLLQHETTAGVVNQIGAVGPRVGTAVKEKFPEVEAVTRVMRIGRLTAGNDPLNRQYEQITIIDKSFFSVMPFRFVEGTPATAFSQAGGVILTEKLAAKYFGKEKALHKKFLTNVFEGVVAGVIADFPPNTHFEAGFIIPEQTAAAKFDWFTEFDKTNWHRNSSVTYFKINPKASVAALETKITALAKENWPKDQTFAGKFTLQPAAEIHLYEPEVKGEINNAKGNLFYVSAFFWIAVVILLVACFNYTGLLNVSFLTRTKEIGVRKVVGAGKKQLIMQYVTESLLLTAAALAIAFVMLLLTKPFFVEIFGQSFNWSYLPASRILVLCTAGFGFCLLSVAYPAFVISRKNPVTALKEKQKKQGVFSLQKTVLTFQFTVTIAIIACSLLFYNQVQYIKNKDLGLQADGMVVVDINSGKLRSDFEAIKTELGRIPEVTAVSVTSRVPGEWKILPVVGVVTATEKSAQPRDMLFLGADKDFIKAYEVKLTAGENFSGLPGDSSKVLINQTAANALGLKNPVGQWIEIPSANFNGDKVTLETPFKAQVAGVTADFYFEDFHQKIRPMIISNWNNPIQLIDYYSIRIKTTDWASTLASLKKVNNQFDPENPMEYNMLEDKMQRFLENDMLRNRLLFFFTAVIIFISCMGLFAVAAFSMKYRTKEIGIRKVLGASVTQLIWIISTEFLLLLGIAFLFATPLAFYIMNVWLDNYAYRITIEWWMFGLAGLSALVIMTGMVGSQALRAAITNPVKSIRTE